MTAEVNSPAAAACPHASKAASSSDSTKTKDESCGFGAQMLNIARHAAAGGEWEVTGSSGKPRLSQDREVSSIPKSDFTPAHQTGTQGFWEYPSEEMYFKAMKRKGWDPEASQMKTIVAIHNSVNEQSWREVLEWEARHGHGPASPPKLKRFIGRPSDYSPKARMMHMLGWSVLPFDRHDWIVERADGTEVRYVIDFYSGQPQPGKPLSVYLDVRPALDSFESVVDRVRGQFEEKIKPLLPFRGAFVGDSQQNQQTQQTEQHAPAPSTEGRSSVVPRSEA